MAKHINAGSFVNLSITDLQKTYELPSIRTPHTKHSHLIKHALAGITITLAPGLYGLLGPNGAGKSTLIHIITGSLAPDSGEVRWCGKPAMGIVFRRILGYMPQQQGLYDSYTGRRFLAYMAALKEIPRKTVAAEIARVAGQAPFCLFRRHEAAPTVGIRSAWRCEAVDFRRTNGRS